MHHRKLILFIACSLDGFIADKDGGLGWLDMVAAEGQDYGYSDIVKQTDTFILGRKTYDKVLTFGMHFPHDDRQTYVITSTPRASENNLHFYSGSVVDLLKDLRSKEGKDIHLDGGGQVIHSFMKENLVDEYIISVIPTLLGEGIPLFVAGSKPQIDLELIKSTAYPSGLVQLHYCRRK